MGGVRDTPLMTHKARGSANGSSILCYCDWHDGEGRDLNDVHSGLDGSGKGAAIC